MITAPVFSEMALIIEMIRNFCISVRIVRILQ